MSTDKTWNVEDLSDAELKNSPTWLKYVDVCGRCHRCKEMTGALDPCCGVSIDFEGGSLHYEDLWEEIENEMNDYYSAQVENTEDE